MQEGYVESFDSRRRDEFLNINIFLTFLHACVELTDWRCEYNHMRRHSSLGYKTPTECAGTCICIKPD